MSLESLLIVLIDSFPLFWVDKIITGTEKFVSVLFKDVPSSFAFVMIQVDDHVRMTLISQLIKGISRVLQKLVNVLINDTVINGT